MRKVILSLLTLMFLLGSTTFADPPDKTTDHGQGNTGNGNSGQGVGNTGPGNQGNGPNPDSGNAGGNHDHGSNGSGSSSGGSTGGSSTGGSTSGGTGTSSSGGGTTNGSSSGGETSSSGSSTSGSGSGSGSTSGGTGTSTSGGGSTSSSSSSGSSSSSSGGSSGGTGTVPTKPQRQGKVADGDRVMPPPPQVPNVSDSCTGDPVFDQKFLVYKSKDGSELHAKNYVWWRFKAANGCLIVGWFYLDGKKDTLVFVEQQQGRKLQDKGIYVHYDNNEEEE